MVPVLGDICEAMRRFAGSFDASRITAADAEQVVAEVAALEAAAATVKALAAARAAESNRWIRSGARSPAHLLAQETGASVGEAMRTLETGRRLADQPTVREAAAAGELSAAQAAAITDAAAVDPAAAGRLLDVAGRRSLAELREECQRVKAAADRDAEARRARIHAARSLRHWTGKDGTGHLQLTDNPERIAAVLAGIGPARERLFRQARADGRRERADALDADALVETLAGPATGPAMADPSAAPRRADAKIIVRVDWDTLLRGYPIDGEVCEIAGHGPIAVSAVRDMIDSGDPFLAAVATRGRQVTGVAHLGRRTTAHQDTALQWRDPGCVAEGCPRHVRLQKDHRERWADTKITLVDLMDRLCEHHHALKTHHGWALLPGTGKRPFVPPDDHRHPARTPAKAAGP